MNRAISVVITCRGDESVGIPGNCVTIDEIGVDADDLDREPVRERLAECWSQIWGEPATVEFSDEIEALLEAEREVQFRGAP